ncbi:MAG: DNA-3-methyladenine glycosylase, partial [Patescibacteria group bacterium]
QSFYARPTLKVAQELLGCFLCRQLPSPYEGKGEGGVVRCKIVETEAYLGFKDLASHAARGRTARNTPMFGPAGYTYVYFTYGMHYMLNIVTERKNYPAAILIRAVEPLNLKKYFVTKSPSLSEEGGGGGGVLIKTNQSITNEAAVNKINHFITAGPAKLTKFLHIDKSLNNISVFTKKYGLWVESGAPVPPAQIVRAKRVGVDYAGKYKNKLWRFYIKNNKFVSRPLMSAAH